MKQKIKLFLGAAFIAALVVAPAQTAPEEYNRETPVVKAVRQVGPAVVNISSEYEVRTRANPFSGFGLNPFFDSFFKDFFDSGIERRAKRTSLGSGVIIDGQRGLILTNAHVIARTAAITVLLQDERELPAQIVGADPDSDLAVLKIESQAPLPSIQMGTSDDLLIGETVIAIGNPFGFSHTVTTGVISAVNRSVRTEERLFRDFIQIDASINPGNSGGPLLNINGELIGINTAIYAKAQGIGFAIPIDHAKRIVDDLVRYGEVVFPWIGITPQDLDPDLAAYLSVPGSSGVLVKAVEATSPAEKAGIQEGDIVIELGGRAVRSVEDYKNQSNQFAAGETITVTVWRKGKTLSARVVTRVYPEQRALELGRRLLGVTVEDIDAHNRRRYGLEAQSGVVITELETHSDLSRSGVRSGDIIHQIDDDNIDTLDDFKKAIVKHRQKKSLVILVQRGKYGYYVTVDL